MNDQLDIMVTTACQAHCPFCVQEATFRPHQADDAAFLRAVRCHAGEFHALGGRKIVITGGEPLLRMTRVLDVLATLREIGRFDLIALYTNGEYLLTNSAHHAGQSVPALLAAAGLTCVNLSVHHFDNAINKRIFGRVAMPSTADITNALKRVSLDYRFNLVLQKGAVEDFDSLDRYVRWAFSLGAKDIYAREIFRFAFKSPLSSARYNPLSYCAESHLDSGDLLQAMRSHRDYLPLGSMASPFRQKTESSFLHLPSGRRVFISNLTVGTEDKSALPYLVVMPNGLLYRGWLGSQDRIGSIQSASSKSEAQPDHERGQMA